MNLNNINKEIERILIEDEYITSKFQKTDHKNKNINLLEKIHKRLEKDNAFEEELLSFGLTPSLQSKIYL